MHRFVQVWIFHYFLRTICARIGCARMNPISHAWSIAPDHAWLVTIIDSPNNYVWCLYLSIENRYPFTWKWLWKSTGSPIYRTHAVETNHAWFTASNHAWLVTANITCSALYVLWQVDTWIGFYISLKLHLEHICHAWLQIQAMYDCYRPCMIHSYKPCMKRSDVECLVCISMYPSILDTCRILSQYEKWHMNLAYFSFRKIDACRYLWPFPFTHRRLAIKIPLPI